MKNIITFMAIIAFAWTNAQVAIEKEGMTNGSVILEFNDLENTGGEAKSMILPVVKDDVTPKPSDSFSEGTIWVDQDGIMYCKKADGTNIQLSRQGDTTGYTFEEEVGDGTIIGADTSSATGVLVLESSNQAMILPRVEDVTQIGDKAEYGMMVYEISSKSLAFYNGVEWSFWD